ncbi:MAG TPA: hypothetical protein VGF48_01280 [Thermoanaerobaculia bacterium]
MAVTLKFRPGLVVLCAFFLLAAAPPASATLAAVCSRCATDCYSTYADQLDQCGWRWWCQQGVKGERDACLGNCIIDGCGDFEWFPQPGGEDDSEFWENWLI